MFNVNNAFKFHNKLAKLNAKQQQNHIGEENFNLWKWSERQKTDSKVMIPRDIFARIYYSNFF